MYVPATAATLALDLGGVLRFAMLELILDLVTHIQKQSGATKTQH